MFRFFETRIDPFPLEPPGQPPTGLLAFLMHYSRPVLPWLGLMALFTGLTSLLEVVFVGFMGSLVDWLTVADPETFFDTFGWTLIGMGVLVIVVFPVMVLMQSLIEHQTIFGNYPMIVRWMAHRTILRQSMTFFQDEFAGRVSQKVMQTALAVRETVTKLVDVVMYALVYFTGAMILLGGADLLLTLPLICWLAAYVGMMVHFVPRLRDVSRAQAAARAEMTGRIVDSYTNIQTLKLFAHSQRELGYARGAMDGFMQTVHRQMRLVTQLMVGLQIANSLLLAGVAGLAIYAWHQSLISLGVIAVGIALVMRIRAMSGWIMWEIAGLFEHIGTVQDGMNTIAQPVKTVDRPRAGRLEVASGEIRFDHVCFDYGRDIAVIDDLTLTVRPGEKVGLVGRSGAGKSTMVNLLMRFYDVDRGAILIDGQDIAGVTQDSLRQQIGMVTQDTSLLHRSIRDNIAYGRPDAELEEIEAAARMAHADAFIRDLADARGRTGYDAHVGDRGVKLSGGQRQRIAIARVLLKNAPILVLDEATSALDSESEAAIQEQLHALMEGKTVIAIAHRLSTIAMLDRLIVLDAGRIAETGAHEELLKRDGLYAQMWRRQSGGFLDAGPQTQAAE